MDQLQIFNHPSFGEVEVIDVEGNPWFGATRTAMSLGYSNPHKAIIDHCKSRGLTKREVLTDGGSQQVNFISEGNLYRLISKSRLETAELFESWIFDEVLPTIRKNGSYSVQPKSQAELLLMYAEQFVNMEKRVDQMEQTVTTIKDTIIHRDEDWRRWIKKLFNSSVMHTPEKDFQAIRNESYRILEERARCDLNTRQRNLKSRLEHEGATKTKVSSVTKMDVIEADTRLKEIYTSIVKELSIKMVPVGT